MDGGKTVELTEAIERVERADEALDWFDTLPPHLWTDTAWDMFVEATRECVVARMQLKQLTASP